MAKIHKNAIIQGLSGSIGDLVFRQMADGSTLVCKKPDFSRRVFSQEQKDHQSRFKQAAAYAREAARSQPIYAKLARKTMKNAYNWALSDWFHPPVIHEIMRVGGKLRVSASDNVQVARVWLRIMGSQGELLEEGGAVQVDPAHRPDQWEYAPNAEGKVEATAWDLAGNRAVAVL